MRPDEASNMSGPGRSINATQKLGPRAAAKPSLKPPGRVRAKAGTRPPGSVSQAARDAAVAAGLRYEQHNPRQVFGDGIYSVGLLYAEAPTS